MSSGGTFTFADYPGATATYAMGINNSGTIVGYYADTNYVTHGFTLSGTTPASLDYYPGATATYALAINDAGTIVGYWADANQVKHGFTLSNGAYESFDYPGATDTYPSGINKEGTIVGTYSDATGNRSGFTRSKTGVFAPMGSFATYAFGINDTGSIVGCWPFLGDCFVLTGYTANIINVANIDNASDTFTVLMDVNKGGTPAGNGCSYVLKIVDAGGRTAVQQSCAFLDQGTGRHKVSLQITGDNTQPNARARYIENGSFYSCNSAGSSAGDLSSCSLIGGTPSDFSVYGTTFDIGKHAWQFKNGAYDGKSSQRTTNEWMLIHNNFWFAGNAIASYLNPEGKIDFWDGGGLYFTVIPSPAFRAPLNQGLCYGLANSAIANYTHQDSSVAWGIDAFTQASWDADIADGLILTKIQVHLVYLLLIDISSWLSSQ